MNEVSKGEGRTILFVSHNMAAIKSLCTNAILLEHGVKKYSGVADKAIAAYLNENFNEANRKLFGGSYDFLEFRLNEIAVIGTNFNDEALLLENDEIKLITDITLKTAQDIYHVTYHLFNEMGEVMFSFSHNELKLKQARNRLVCLFPPSFFNPGNYYLKFHFIKNAASAVFVENDIIRFSIVDAQRELGVYMGREPGYIKPKFNWEITYLND